MKIFVVNKWFLRNERKSKKIDVMPEDSKTHLFTSALDTYKFLNQLCPDGLNWDIQDIMNRPDAYSEDLHLTSYLFNGVRYWVVLEDSLGEEFDCPLEGRLTVKVFDI